MVLYTIANLHYTGDYSPMASILLGISYSDWAIWTRMNVKAGIHLIIRCYSAECEFSFSRAKMIL